MRAPPLQLKNSWIGAITLQPKTAETYSPKVNVSVENEFARDEKTAANWLVKMKVKFKGAEDMPAQYEGSIEVSGIFNVIDEMPEEQHLRVVAVTCPTILYSTAREAIAMLTGRGPNGTFLLPSVSFTDMNISPAQNKLAESASAEH